MALNANALITLDLAKDHLDIPLANTDQDVRLELIINMVSNAIEQLLSRTIKSANYIEQYDGTSQPNLILDHFPVTAINNIWDSYSRTFNSTTLRNTDDYDIIEDNIVRLHTGHWPRGSQNIQVDYVAGFVTVPEDIQYATLMLVELYYRMRFDRRIGRASQGKGDENVSFIQGWPEDVTAILMPYKDVVFSGRKSSKSS